MNAIERRTVDLTGYPDLVVIYLGMRPRSLRGFFAMGTLGKQINAAVAAQPEGMLLHENVYWGLVPPHLSMRQYWQDFDALERWARSLPHQKWWRDFLRDPKATGFWHETYFMSGGMEAVYDNMPGELGLLRFAPVELARGRMFSARSRARREGEATVASAIAEEELYS